MLDDLLFGPGRMHPLDDALRRWFAARPGDAERLAASAPLGPLAITHRTCHQLAPVLSTSLLFLLVRSGRS